MAADPEYSIDRQIFADDTRYPSLTQVEKDIKAYCESVASEDERQKCFNTLARLHAEERKAYSGIAVLESAEDAQATLERLESMARQLSTCGGTKLMVDALAHLHQIQDTYDGVGSESSQAVRVNEQSEEQKEVRARLREVFDRVDTNGSGTVDIAEFRAAMDFLGKHVDGYMVAEICQAIDVQNHLTFDQFCDIVDAEEIRSPEAARLRAILRDSSDDRYADWIKSLC